MELHELLSDIPQGLDGIRISPKSIETLDSLIQETYHPSSSPLITERFRSKKNAVFHILLPDTNHDFVAKLFVTDAFEKEVSILRKSAKDGLLVPEVISAQNRVILMTHIPGEPLVDLVNRTFDSSLMEALAEWYFHYHTLHCEIKGDPRLRNFIYSEQGVYGVDFEESRAGNWILDIGGIAASLFDTNPIFDTRKRNLAWNIFEYYLSLKHSERDVALDKLYTNTIVDTLKYTAELRNDKEIFKIAITIETDGF